MVLNLRAFAFLILAVLSLPWYSLQARELKIIFSQYTPPYVFEKGDGIVVDIVRGALEPAGYRVAPVYVPIGRGFEFLPKNASMAPPSSARLPA